MNDVYLEPDEVAKMLSLSKRQLEYLVQHRKIPATKVGRLTRFSKAELEAWLKANSRVAHA
jgi:excisionase family DNA binding protein